METSDFEESRNIIMRALGGVDSEQTFRGDYFMHGEFIKLFGSNYIDFNSFEADYQPSSVVSLFATHAGIAVDVEEEWRADSCIVKLGFGGEEVSVDVNDLGEYSDLRQAVFLFISKVSDHEVVELPGQGMGENHYCVIPVGLKEHLQVVMRNTPSVEMLIHALESNDLFAASAVARCSSDAEALYNLRDKSGDRPIFAAIRTGDIATVQEVLENASPFTLNADGKNAIEYARGYFTEQEVISLFEVWEPDMYPEYD